MSKPKYTKWQEKSIEYITGEIFPYSSRAFLADEAGLGKTVTAAGVMDKMYEDFCYKLKHDEEFCKKHPDGVMHVLYFAPSGFIAKNACEKLKGKSRYEDKILIKEARLTEFIDSQGVINTNNLPSTGIVLLCLSAAVNCCDINKKEECVKLCDYYKDIIEKTQIKDDVKRVLGQIVTDYEEKCKVFDKRIDSKPTIDPYYAEVMVLNEIKPQLVIWDEYHRYMGIFKEHNIPIKNVKYTIYNSVVYYEQNSKEMKTLFLSATPYKSNITGENEKTIENNGESVIREEKLPSFQDFIKLCGLGIYDNYFKAETLNKCVEDYKIAWYTFQGTPDEEKWDDIKIAKNQLEQMYKKVFIRHERTSLAGEKEEYKYIFEPFDRKGIPCEKIYSSAQLNDEYKPVFIEQWKNSSILNSGCNLEARKWSSQMPYIMSFSEGYTKAGQVLCGLDKNINYKNLFLSDEKYIEQIKGLNNSNLQIHEIIKASARDEEMMQLLWIPPAVRYYSPGKNSIYEKYKDHSKLLIFAEQGCFQRGLPYLLSEYVDHISTDESKNDNAMSEISFDLKLTDSGNLESLKKLTDLGKEVYEQIIIEKKILTLDGILEKYKEKYDQEEIYAAIGAPAVCAKMLGIDDPEKIKQVEDSFNTYFSQESVKRKLCEWMKKKGIDDKIAILRYCCEGNLFSVMQEWFMSLDNNIDKLIEQLEVLECDEKINAIIKDQSNNNIEPKTVRFALRLTTDRCDNGNSGTGKKNGEDDFREKVSQAFSSPFWPMILVTGRGAQESMDFHPYCNRIMHYTIPKGAVSIEQREGRINRYRSLLIKRRAAERLENEQPRSINDIFIELEKNLCDNPLYPNWSIPNKDSRHHFEKIVAFWPYTEEAYEWMDMKAMLDNYRSVFGVPDDYESLSKIASDAGKKLEEALINLEAPDCNPPTALSP